MKKATLFVWLVCITSSVALAQRVPTSGIQWQRTVAEAQEEATSRNVPIFVSLHQQSSYTQMGTLFDERNKKFADFINYNCVALVGLVDKATKNEKSEAIGVKAVAHVSMKARNPYDNKIEDMCTLFYGLTCKEHEKIYNELSQKLKVKNVPANFILNPDLSISSDLNQGQSQNSGGGGGGLFGMDSGSGCGITDTDIKNAILQGQKSLGTGLIGSDWQKVKKMQSQADKAFDKGNYREAISKLNSIKKLGRKLPDSYSQFVDGKLGDINSKGEELLDKALEQSDPKIKEAKIKEVMEKFKGLDVEKKAKDELDKLKENK